MGWSFLDDGAIKMNVDGTIRNGGRKAGCGGVLGDATSAWILGFSRNLSSTGVLPVEIRAMEIGLNLAWQKGFRTVILESDSKLAVNMVTNGVQDSHPMRSTV